MLPLFLLVQFGSYVVVHRFSVAAISISRWIVKTLFAKIQGASLKPWFPNRSKTYAEDCVLSA